MKGHVRPTASPTSGTTQISRQVSWKTKNLELHRVWAGFLNDRRFKHLQAFLVMPCRVQTVRKMDQLLPPFATSRNGLVYAADDQLFEA